MIIINIMGGLGNQMFQYACVASLAYNNDSEFSFDLGDLGDMRRDGGRHFGLNVFNINGNININETLINEYKKSRYYLESSFTYDEKIMHISTEELYLNGYWQSEKYFTATEALIRRDFTPTEKNFIKYDKKIQNLIKDTESVSVHFRRGDYLMPPYNKFHGVCSMEYYYKSINYIKERVSNPTFFIFSDDIDWVKMNLHIDDEHHFVSDSLDRDSKNNIIDDNAHEDMILMSNCKHNIGANSSFSWWGSWLNDNPHKIVTVPKKWFASNSNDTKDLFCSSWKSI